MVSEITINRIANALTEVVDFGGTKEQTTIISNMEVVNAAPTGLSGFVTIKDDRDGDTILATKVPGVLYANGDLVNVLFIDGTEPIAFQQSSASGGDPVAVSKLVSPDLAIDPVISADNSGDVTLAGTGDLILPDDIIHSGDTDTLISLEDDKIVLQAGSLEMVSIIEAATDEVVVNDAQVDINFRVEGDTEENLLFVDAGQDRVGIGTNAPSSLFHASGTATVATFGDGTSSAQIRFNGSVASRDMIYETTGSARWIFRVDSTAEAGSDVGSDFRIISRTDAAAFKDTVLFGKRSNARVGINNVLVPLAQLHVDQDSTTAAVPVALLDQADVDEPFTKFIGTAAAATLTRSIVDVGDVTTATVVGYYKIEIDDIGNQVTDGDYFVAFYSLV